MKAEHLFVISEKLLHWVHDQIITHGIIVTVRGRVSINHVDSQLSHTFSNFVENWITCKTVPIHDKFLFFIIPFCLAIGSVNADTSKEENSGKNILHFQLVKFNWFVITCKSFVFNVLL